MASVKAVIRDLGFLTESWSPSFSDFGETFAVVIDIAKTFDSLASTASLHLSALSSRVSSGCQTKSATATLRYFCDIFFFFIFFLYYV